MASTSTVVRNNTVSEVWGEGINAHSGSQYTLIENNRLYAVRSAGIYADAAPDTTIRRNIVVGTANSEWWRGSNSVGPGIVLNNEKYHYAVGGGSLPRKRTVAARQGLRQLGCLYEPGHRPLARPGGNVVRRHADLQQHSRRQQHSGSDECLSPNPAPSSSTTLC